MTEQLVFRAIADPTRRSIMAMLATGERSLNQIASDYEMSRPAVAKHLGVLREGGLIEVEARGRERVHRLRPEALKTVSDWLSFYSQFWDEKLENLKQAVEADDE
ncbi:metalloregulator ArsR/SmtB family transcription factor [Hyphomonas sp. FCG-A18]|uniref:ArsR/SmtB family transcription factor n=1 Tax=Hyphomonas sp. FCG-A18 TaxID=3080019 RepID=UPI002B321FBD|nr:metalloregulator ArsR/SmtB family transcription factor [Hyphomonas sp. FCG-A18]